MRVVMRACDERLLSRPFAAESEKVQQLNRFAQLQALLRQEWLLQDLVFSNWVSILHQSNQHGTLRRRGRRMLQLPLLLGCVLCLRSISNLFSTSPFSLQRTSFVCALIVSPARCCCFAEGPFFQNSCEEACCPGVIPWSDWLRASFAEYIGTLVRPLPSFRYRHTPSPSELYSVADAYLTAFCYSSWSSCPR